MSMFTLVISCLIPNCLLSLLWLHLFIFSGVISLLISSSIVGTYLPGEFIFQFPIYLPFHTVHGVLKTRILKWFASPFSSGPCFVRTLHHNPSILSPLYVNYSSVLKKRWLIKNKNKQKNWSWKCACYLSSLGCSCIYSLNNENPL